MAADWYKRSARFVDFKESQRKYKSQAAAAAARNIHATESRRAVPSSQRHLKQYLVRVLVLGGWFRGSAVEHWS